METKAEKKVISSKMEKFLNKLREMPETKEELPQKPKSTREEFIQKILEDIEPY